jgi:zinc protease
LNDIARGRKRGAPRGARLATAVKAGATISEHRLANGLRVLVAERHGDPVVAVMTWYKVGARNEREDEAGMSHFLEHMMFKGSRRYAKGEVDRVTTQAGGTNNAFTSYDHTAYWFELASDRWEQALDIELDRMLDLTLDEVEFASEREVVLEELSMGLDDPWRRLADLVQAAVFSRHPYRRPVIGHVDALRALTPAAMRDYYKRFYHPGNATLVICGDVATADALAAVERRFAKLASGPGYAEADPFRPGLDVPPGEQRLRMSWDDQGQRLAMAWPAAAVGARDDWALDVLGAVLTGGRSSRLYRRLVVERGLATNVTTHNDARIEGGIFWIFAECAQGVKPVALEAALEAELESLRKSKVPARELARVRSMLAASESQEGETATDLAEDLGEFAVDADWRLAIDGLAATLSISADELRECARRVLDPERRVVGWCVPQAKRGKRA